MTAGSRLRKIRTVTRIRVALWVSALFFVLMPPLHWWHPEGNNHYTVYLNEIKVGVVEQPQRAETLYREVRRAFDAAQKGISFVDMPVFRYEGEEVLFGTVDGEETLRANMLSAIQAAKTEDIDKAYSIKVGGTMVSVSGAEQATEVLQEALGAYDTEGKYAVTLVRDTGRELNVLVPEVKNTEESVAEEVLLKAAGASAVTENREGWDFSGTGTGFSSFTYGITDMHFSEKVEVAEAYLPGEKLVDVQTAKDRLTGLQEQQQIYKVVSGDTLSGISLKVGLPLDAIVALNSELENENSIIRVDQELLITVPEPELSVVWTETARDDRIFDLPTEYVYNDAWYTDKSVTLQQPSAGYHETVAQITRKNDAEISREVLYEEVGVTAVAKVVEIGTKVPPSYIKPLSGGRISSGFGRRNAPTAGATTSHKGVDIATPLGTSVWASCGGTVSFAGWGGAYGNVIFIDHSDGRQTRYAHLSKIYVSVGQKVNQGQVIAASGSTGRSTGPHLHFELRIGGTPVDPRKYVNLN